MDLPYNFNKQHDLTLKSTKVTKFHIAVISDAFFWMFKGALASGHCDNKRTSASAVSCRVACRLSYSLLVMGTFFTQKFPEILLRCVVVPASSLRTKA